LVTPLRAAVDKPFGARETMAENQELRDLIDFPSETLANEVKSNIDISDELYRYQR
jgi:hypothetical protein